MQLFPKAPPAPTTVLDISDLRTPNEFDWRLLESEGIRHGAVTIRGASVVPDTTREARQEAKRRAPRVPSQPVVEAPPAVAAPVHRLPALVPPAPRAAEAPRIPLAYAGLLSAGICVAASLAFVLAAII